MLDRGASDFFFCVGHPPMMRMDGQIEPIRYRTLREQDFELYFGEATPPERWAAFQKTGDVDFSYEMPGVARFRINLFKQHNGAGASVRIIPARHFTFEELGLPPQTDRLTRLQWGLVLVTGPTGSGKSTTLSAMIHALNTQFNYHILTIEEPIEFVHPARRSLVTQREVGRSATTYASALRAALREDPDVIMVGDLRDRETVEMALTAAETGVLVIGTLHTNSAAKTIDRIVNLFPNEEVESVRHQIGSVLKGLLCQQLVRRKEGGRVAAFELAFGSPALANLIREGKTNQIDSLIQLGKTEGMLSMDTSLLNLVRDRVVDAETAYEKALDKRGFRAVLARELDIQLGRDAAAEEEMLRLVEQSSN